MSKEQRAKSKEEQQATRDESLTLTTVALFPLSSFLFSLRPTAAGA